MKTLRYTIILSALLLGGCKDLLDTTPNDRISTDIFWRTQNDAIYGANAVYTFLTETQTAGQPASHFISWDGMTDIGYTHQPQSPESFILQGQFDGLNSRVYLDYQTLYAGIRAANTFLANVGSVTGADPALITRLTGEVRALRAHYYARLAMLFGDVPLITEPISLPDSRSVTRTPVSQVWDFVSTEFTQAADVLPNVYSAATDKGRVTKAAALGLKSRAMLYAGRYQEAADAAQLVMAMPEYGLYPTYKTLFTTAAEGNKEVILDIQFVKGTQANDIFNILTPQSVTNGKSLYVPTNKMVDAFEMKNGKAITDPASGFDPKNPYVNRDPRLSYSVYVAGDLLPNGKVFNPLPNSSTGDAVGSTFTVSPTGFNLKKYVNSDDAATATNSGINLILLRYAEVLLTYAEAKIELNVIDQSVYDAINAVRQRSDVMMPVITTGKTQAEMRDIVRHERLVELAFEGQHFFDIRRWKTAENVMPGKVYGMTYVDPSNTLKTVEVTGWVNYWDNKNYLWPIPELERNLNGDLAQNPGW
jgi:hypothetical protein